MTLEQIDLAARRANSIPRGITSMHGDIAIARAKGAEVWDLNGKRYIDFATGIAVCNVGHCHPKVVAAAHKQIDLAIHTCFAVASYELYVDVAEQLNRLVPGEFSKKTQFVSTGAEAVENAIKIARAYTGRPGIIAFSGAFHGRTMFAGGMTAKIVPYKVGFGPFPADIYHVPYPNDYRDRSIADSLRAIEDLFKSTIPPDRVAALFVEPVQGEGGFIVAPGEFLKQLRALCDRHGIVMVADEIQTGFGRTGKMFAMEHFGVAADITTTAKSLAAGFPLAAVTGRADIMDAPVPGSLGGTYAGNPVALAAALAVIDIMADENLVENANHIGRAVRQALDGFAQRHASIGEVRGLGAMLALELVTDRQSKQPDPELAMRIVAEAAKRGLLLLTCGTYGNVVRLLPPLIANNHEVEEAMHALRSALEASAA
jgi:4-aminobutyrate aminotransferase/(S)-3-amino-2-methylpropionate transaminase